METMRQDCAILSHQLCGRRYRGEREGDTGEKERERQGRERERERGERERGAERKKLQTQKNSWNFILSCFIPRNELKHDSGL